jgi:hypothetical protein
VCGVQAFRLLDVHDGKLDGTIAISTDDYRKRQHYLALRRRNSSKLFSDRSPSGNWGHDEGSLGSSSGGKRSSLTRSTSKKDGPLGA